eukprot:CAMPEP_0182914886 /NCGR_PEP_ID=MMETSP0034_2-20130328/38802_1 /TAXON_ID=156128 /ORGANISM="Nephroselmis pyriformis, Strain CCMP717" /LENGTH=272 /DNA_ID=CAMNT_0025051677 /DNA_START=275 /DNA_END=1093 /DNA_ORIENTATION=+
MEGPAAAEAEVWHWHRRADVVRADVVLRVGRAEFHCHSQVLSLGSAVLANAISLQPAKEEEPIVITLEEDAGLTPAAMRSFLGLMYPDGWTSGEPLITDALVLPVMRLADRYDAPTVAARVGDWILATGQSKAYGAMLKDDACKSAAVTNAGNNLWGITKEKGGYRMDVIRSVDAAAEVLGSMRSIVSLKTASVKVYYTRGGVKHLLSIISECGSIASGLGATHLADACKSFIASIFPSVKSQMRYTSTEVTEMLALPKVWNMDTFVTLLLG